MDTTEISINIKLIDKINMSSHKDRLIEILRKDFSLVEENIRLDQITGDNPATKEKLAITSNEIIATFRNTETPNISKIEGIIKNIINEVHTGRMQLFFCLYGIYNVSYSTMEKSLDKFIPASSEIRNDWPNLSGAGLCFIENKSQYSLKYYIEPDEKCRYQITVTTNTHISNNIDEIMQLSDTLNKHIQTDIWAIMKRYFI